MGVRILVEGAHGEDVFVGSGDGNASTRSKRCDVNVAVAPDEVHKETVVVAVAGIECE